MNGVVVMRVVGKDQGIRLYGPAYALPASYGRFARYWDYGWGTLHEPGEVRSGAPLSVETLVYSLDQGGKLVWASTSRSVNPRDLDSLITGIADATARAMFRPPPGPGSYLGPSVLTGDTANRVD